tara:strand:- start:40 stop:348 length:309 start_codon:yes stop_codon:yes gene_type:complete
MNYRKTQTRNGIDYYRIDLDDGWEDVDFKKLPAHWPEYILELEREDKKSNKNWPDPFYSGREGRRKMSMDGRRLVDGIIIVWDLDNDNFYITWNGKPLEEAA